MFCRELLLKNRCKKKQIILLFGFDYINLTTIIHGVYFIIFFLQGLNILSQNIIFYIFSILSIAGAIMVVTNKNPVISAISLVLTLFSTAVLFILLNAHFAAAIQVLVYAGAIMVLFLFTVMFLNIKDDELRFDALNIPRKLTFLFIFIITTGYFASKLFITTNSFSKLDDPHSFGTVKEVGTLLFTDYLLPFELTSILIVVAIVGVVVIAKVRKA